MTKVFAVAAVVLLLIVLGVLFFLVPADRKARTTQGKLIQSNQENYSVNMAALEEFIGFSPHSALPLEVVIREDDSAEIGMKRVDEGETLVAAGISYLPNKIEVNIYVNPSYIERESTSPTVSAHKLKEAKEVLINASVMRGLSTALPEEERLINIGLSDYGLVEKYKNLKIVSL